MWTSVSAAICARWFVRWKIASRWSASTLAFLRRRGRSALPLVSYPRERRKQAIQTTSVRRDDGASLSNRSAKYGNPDQERNSGERGEFAASRRADGRRDDP